MAQIIAMAKYKYSGSFSGNSLFSSNVEKSVSNQIKSNIVREIRRVRQCSIDVQRINNEYLYTSFLIKKEEMENQGKEVQIEELYHATDRTNVQSIAEENLDWRLVSRTKFGVGVSFTKDLEYGNYHSSRNNGRARAFIICDVLVGKLQNVSNNSCIYPTTDVDTFLSYNDKVYVKFDDFTYYPKYVAYYNIKY